MKKGLLTLALLVAVGLAIAAADGYYDDDRDDDDCDDDDDDDGYYGYYGRGYGCRWGYGRRRYRRGYGMGGMMMYGRGYRGMGGMYGRGYYGGYRGGYGGNKGYFGNYFRRYPKYPVMKYYRRRRNHWPKKSFKSIY